jgi:beta-glucosidase
MSSFLDDPVLVKQSAREALDRKLSAEADIDLAVTRILKVRFRFGHFDADDSKNPYANITKAVICSEKHSLLAKKAAQESVVLLKNDGILPLSREKIRRIAVVGPLGAENMPDWYSGNPPYEVTPLAGIAAAFPDSKVDYTDGCDTCSFKSEKTGGWLRVLPDGTTALDGNEQNRSVFTVCDWGYGALGFRDLQSKKYLGTTDTGALTCTADGMWGWFVRELFFCRGDQFLPEIAHGQEGKEAVGIAAGRGKSVYNKPYQEGGVEKINALLGDLRIVRLSDGLALAAETAKGADAAVVILGNHSLVGARECIDRENLDLPNGMAALLEAVSKVNANTLLFLIAGYPYAIGPQEKYARAILFTTHGAQEVGSAVGGALAGDFSPAGRLSITWYKDTKDFPDLNDYDIIKNKRTYLYYDKPVLYPFGYGLSYTSFS